MKSRTLRRIRQTDRQRLIHARVVKQHADTEDERKKVEKAWELDLGLEFKKRLEQATDS